MIDKVILGMPGPWAKNHREKSDHYTTKIGGIPDWPFPKEELRAGTVQCRVCGSTLCLVAQVFTPILNGDLRVEERVVYVFGCAMPSCGSNRNSWRVLRIQKSSFGGEKSSYAGEGIDSAKCVDGCVDEKRELSNDDDDDLDLEALSKALSKAMTLASKSKKPNSSQKSKAVVKNSPGKLSNELIDTLTPDSASYLVRNVEFWMFCLFIILWSSLVYTSPCLLIAVVPCFYICSQEDSSSKSINAVGSSYSSLCIKENQSGLNDHQEEETWEEERYEYDKALCADRTYLKFKKRLDAYPEQCFRYSIGGKPLLAMKELEEPGSCQSCGAPRQYEMQLMPPLLYFLHEADDDSSTHTVQHWDWMTLIAYTCSKSCFDAAANRRGSWSIIEEAVIVQVEKPIEGLATLGHF
ncbi:hypothetical protein Scep_018658 [Stephania cephalantha]|uniref:Programmed cell death protein 2 C-terminal domain-containing protein n=1 Tax=Stephania cephalantha TaxID=152367 RepID=A0AAP0I9C5_9MAGN